MILENEASVRGALERRLRSKVQNAIWGHLVKTGYVEACLDPELESAFEELVQSAKDLRALVSGNGSRKPPKKKSDSELEPDGRLLALARIIAIEVSNDVQIRTFRNEVLGGKLLEQSEVASWIEEHDDLEKPTVWARVPINEGAIDPADCQWGIETDVLEYADPHSEWTVVIPVRRGSPLDTLRILASRISNKYPPLHEARAVDLILTGNAPPLPKARVTIRRFSHVPPRITLDLDPRLSATEVATLYSGHRKEVFQGQDKPMTPKHLELAAFAEQHDAGTWADRMNEWNRKFSEWPYNRYETFARDSIKAWERVTGRSWTRQRGARR